MNYRYFISYNVVIDGRIIPGRNQSIRYRLIQNMVDIEEIEELIALGLSKPGREKPLVIINNFILFGEMEGE